MSVKKQDSLKGQEFVLVGLVGVNVWIDYGYEKAILAVGAMGLVSVWVSLLRNKPCQ